MEKKGIILLLTAIVLIGSFTLGVVSKRESNKTVKTGIYVTATIFPVYDIARAVIGDKGNVEMIVPPGIEPHSYEPAPADMIKVTKSDMFFYVDNSMEPWVGKFLEQTVSGTAIVTAAKNIEMMNHEENGVEHAHDEEGEQHHNEGVYDPHVWLDPLLAKQIVDNFVVAVSEKDPENKEYYTKNGEIYKVRLESLHEKITKTIEKCRVKTILYGGHYAFGYFSKRYGIDHISPYENFSPNSEPTPGNIKKLIKEVEKLGVKYIFTEELINPKAAEIIAKEAGVEVLVLHGAHNVSKEELEKNITYFDIMEKNIENLKKGLDYNE